MWIDLGTSSTVHTDTQICVKKKPHGVRRWTKKFFKLLTRTSRQVQQCIYSKNIKEINYHKFIGKYIATCKSKNVKKRELFHGTTCL